MEYWGNVIIESNYKILTKNINVEILPMGNIWAQISKH